MTASQPNATPADWPTKGQEFGPTDFGPFGPDALARYAAASGDTNPLHLDEAVAKAAGLDAPPVHGMFMMSCFEPAIRAWRPDLVVARLSAKFLRPVLSGQGFTLSGRVVRSTEAPRPEAILRLTARGMDGTLAIMGEATLLAPSAS